MRLQSLLRARLCLPIGGIAALAGFLAFGQGPSVQPQSDTGAVWVYFTSICPRAGDGSDCAELKAAIRPVFSTLEACASHRDEDLGRAGNPHLLGSCLRQREA